MSNELTESTGPLGEISHGPSAFEQFLDRNQKGIAIFAVLLALGAAGLVIHRGISTSQEQNAGAALVAADDLAAFQAVIKDHSGSSAEGSAAVLLADSQWKEGQQDAAVTTLKEFIEKNSQHPARYTAQASLGSKLIAQGKSGDAARVFQDLAGDPSASYIAPYALIALGDIAKADGKLDEADAFYQRARVEFPDSPFIDSATRRISLLKATAPTEIEPPAPAPDAEPAAPEAAPTPPPAPVTPENTESAPEEDATEATPAEETPVESEDPAEPTPSEQP